MRSIRDDLETLPEDDCDRLDRIFASLEPRDHAGRIVALADAPEISDYDCEG